MRRWRMSRPMHVWTVVSGSWPRGPAAALDDECMRIQRRCGRRAPGPSPPVWEASPTPQACARAGAHGDETQRTRLHPCARSAPGRRPAAAGARSGGRRCQPPAVQRLRRVGVRIQLRLRRRRLGLGGRGRRSRRLAALLHLCVALPGGASRPSACAAAHRTCQGSQALCTAQYAPPGPQASVSAKAPPSVLPCSAALNMRMLPCFHP